jgi:hypothetical protein
VPWGRCLEGWPGSGACQVSGGRVSGSEAVGQGPGPARSVVAVCQAQRRSARVRGLPGMWWPCVRPRGSRPGSGACQIRGSSETGSEAVVQGPGPARSVEVRGGPEAGSEAGGLGQEVARSEDAWRQGQGAVGLGPGPGKSVEAWRQGQKQTVWVRGRTGSWRPGGRVKLTV